MTFRQSVSNLRLCPNQGLHANPGPKRRRRKRSLNQSYRWNLTKRRRKQFRKWKLARAGHPDAKLLLRGEGLEALHRPKRAHLHENAAEAIQSCPIPRPLQPTTSHKPEVESSWNVELPLMLPTEMSCRLPRICQLGGEAAPSPFRSRTINESGICVTCHLTKAKIALLLRGCKKQSSLRATSLGCVPL